MVPDYPEKHTEGDTTSLPEKSEGPADRKECGSGWYKRLHGLLFGSWTKATGDSKDHLKKGKLPDGEKINKIVKELAKERKRIEAECHLCDLMQDGWERRRKAWENGTDLSDKELAKAYISYRTCYRYELCYYYTDNGEVAQKLIQDFRTPEGREEVLAWWDELYQKSQKRYTKFFGRYETWKRNYEAYTNTNVPWADRSKLRELVLAGVPLGREQAVKVRPLPN